MNRRYLWIVPVVLCLGATECRLDEDDDLGPEDDIEFATLVDTNGNLVRGTVSGVRNARLVVIRDINDFTELWSSHVSGVSPQPAQPDVAFGSRMVIAVFAGDRPTGGYTITVEDIRENNEFIAVDVEIETPGDGCTVTQAITQPHHMVVLDDLETPVNFNQTTVKGDACETT